MTSPTTCKNNRSVGFANRTKVYLVLSVHDMTQKEIASTWATDKDSKTVQADIIKNIKGMRQNRITSVDNSCDFCSRGLEHMQNNELLELHKFNKENVINSVLDEQDRQWDAGIYDEKKIAAASTRNSKSAQDDARAMGMSDEAFVRRMGAKASRTTSSLQEINPGYNNVDTSLQSLLANTLESSPSILLLPDARKDVFLLNQGRKQTTPALLSSGGAIKNKEDDRARLRANVQVGA